MNHKTRFLPLVRQFLFKTRGKYLITILVTVFLLVTVCFGVKWYLNFKLSKDYSRTLAPDCRYVSGVRDFAFADICLEISDLPNLNAIREISVKLVPKIDSEQAEVWYELSPGIEYVGGDLPWKGNYSTEVPIVLDFKVKFTQNGNQQLQIVATGAVNVMNFYINDNRGKLGSEPTDAIFDLVVPKRNSHK